MTKYQVLIPEKKGVVPIKWLIEGIFVTYAEAIERCMKICGKNYETEPSKDLPRAYFFRKGEEDLDARIVKLSK